VRPMALLHRRIEEVADLAHRLLEIVVHDPVVVQYRPGDILLSPPQFLARLFEAQPQRLSRFTVSLPQPLHQDLGRRWQDEHADRPWPRELTADLNGSLDLN